MSALVDFQQQRKRSKVYPQLNFLLLRKIALEVRLCLCVSEYVVVRTRMELTYTHTEKHKDYVITIHSQLIQLKTVII